jgi:prophage regulatory protein
MDTELPHPTTAPRLLRLPDVLERVGLRRSRLYDLVADGRFPTPVKLGDRAVAWPADEVDDWIRAKIRERDEASP